MREITFNGKKYCPDDLTETAIKYVSSLESTTFHQLQKALHMGYARVQKLVDNLNVIGITDSSGVWNGTSKKIKVLIHSKEEGLKLLKKSGSKFEKESLLIR